MAPPLRRSWPLALPVLPGAGLLALASVLGFALVVLVPGARETLQLVPADLGARPWAVLSYSFVHQAIGPQLISLSVLLLVAPRLESRAGARRTLAYFAAGAGAGALLALAHPAAPMTGAGPATAGVLLGLARHGADEPLFPPLALRGRLPAAAIAAVLLAAGLTAAWSGAERGLACAGLLLAFLVLSRPPRQPLIRQIEAPNSHFDPPRPEAPDASTPWDSIDLDALHEVNRAVVEGLLAEVRALGPGHLRPADRELLDRMKAATR